MGTDAVSSYYEVGSLGTAAYCEGKESFILNTNNSLSSPSFIGKIKPTCGNWVAPKIRPNCPTIPVANCGNWAA